MEKTQKTILLSIYYALGLVAFFNGQIAILTVFLLLLTILLAEKKYISKGFSIALYIAFTIAIINANLQVKDTDTLEVYAPQNMTITGRILTIPTTNNADKTKFQLEVNNIKEEFETQTKPVKAKTLVTIEDTKSNLSKLEIGKTITCRGKLALPKNASNPYQFDYKKYLKYSDIYTNFYVKDGNWKLEKTKPTPYWRMLQKINQTRTIIVAKHAQNLKSPNIELLGGIVFGDDAVNPPDYIKTSFINSGLLHILAASGMNVTLIFGIWFFITRRARLHYKLSIVTGILLILFYTCMTGFGPSILRATLMLIFILLGKLIDRDADSIALLFFVGLLLLIYDPAMINSVGFQLSFLVTFGILYSCGLMSEKLEFIKNNFLNSAVSCCIVPIIAQIYAAPIQMFYFNTFATYSVFANIITIPFLSVVSFIGFIGSVLALIPKVSGAICQFADFILNPFLTMIISVSDFFANAPNSLLTTKHPEIWQIVLFYAIVILLTKQIKTDFENKKLNITLAVVILTFALTFIPIKNNNLEITIFDMGNADAALIKTPENHYILIDSGKLPYNKTSSPAEQIILRYLKNKGIKNLDIYVITHFDSDHAGGTIKLLENIKVKNIYITNYYEPTNSAKMIIKYLDDKNFNAKKAQNGEVIFSEKDLKIKNLVTQTKTPEENTHSIVNLLEYKDFRMLFSADACADTVANFPKGEIKNITILKVGHHGGKGSVDEKLLKATTPKAAIISTGVNPYGHPDKLTTDLLKENNVKTYRTDYNNAIKIRVKDEKAAVKTFITDKKSFEQNGKVIELF